MTTFDTSGMGGAPQQPQQYPQQQPAAPMPMAVPEPADPMGGLDTLALLRDAVADTAEIQPEVIEVPGNVGIRLVCSTDITFKQLQTWQRRSLSPAARKSGKFNSLDMDQLHLNVAVLVGTMLEIQVRDRNDPDTWHTIEDAREHRPLTFTDDAVLRQFGAIDTITALRALFGNREADIVKAGQQVLTAAGWTEDGQRIDGEDGAENPT